MSDDNAASDPVDELRELPREVRPDAALAERTLAALRARSLVHRPTPPRRLGGAAWLMAAGIAAIAFSAGLATGRGAASDVPSPEPSYALLLYGGDTGDDSATHAQRAAEYGRWASATHEGGRIVGGEALGEVVTPQVGAPLLPREGGVNTLVGFFLIRSPDRQAALRLAADCPHLKYGGRVVLREIQPT